MCAFITEDLLHLADEMASAAASLNNQQSYTQFVEARDRMKEKVAQLKSCDKKDK